MTGVEVKIAGETKKISAKAVVLATGGFGADLEMVAKLNPALKGYVTTNQEGSTGDGIALAESEGAELLIWNKSKFTQVLSKKLLT